MTKLFPESPQLFRLSSRREALILGGGSLILALIFCYPLLCDFQYLGPGLNGWLLAGPDLTHFSALPINGDSDMFAELRWVPFYTVRHFHQFPFWNPYKCGGMSMLGNPESGIVTPFLLFYVILGLVPGLLVEIWLHVAIGFAGGYLLGRELNLRPIASLALAGMFMSSSWLPLHVSVGHLNFLPAVYFPWIIALLFAACRMRRWYPAALAGLFCAMTLTEGNYTFVYAAMLVGIVALTLTVVRFDLRPLAVAAIIGMFALAFGAIKLIPVTDWLTLHPRPEFGASWLTMRNSLISIFSRNQDLYRESTGPFYFCEFGGYFGAPFVVLAIIGAIGAGRSTLPWLLGVAAFFDLFRGDIGPHPLIKYVRQIPFGNNMGMCGRWVIPLIFCLSVLVALGAQLLSDHWGRWGPRIALLLVVAGLVDGWVVSSPNYRYLSHTPFEGPQNSASFRQYWVDNPVVMTYIAEANMGSVDCSAYGYHVSRGNVLGYNEPGYRGEYFVLGEGGAKQLGWSPNRLRFDVSAQAPATLVINQNFDKDWQLTSGQGTIVSERDLLAVQVPAGREELTLTYRPAHIVWALLLTFLAAVGAISLWLWETRNYRDVSQT